MITNQIWSAEIEVTQLRKRSDNANSMSHNSFRKLVRHIRRTNRYPAIIVRPLPPPDDDAPVSEYEIIDGHHRVAALRELHHATARCDVWEGINDEEALILLTTLYRLEGSDDPLKRASLIAQLVEKVGRTRTAQMLPEDQERIDRLLEVRIPPPKPVNIPTDESLPEAVTFFLSPSQRKTLERKLRAVEFGKTRSERFIQLLNLSA